MHFLAPQPILDTPIRNKNYNLLYLLLNPTICVFGSQKLVCHKSEIYYQLWIIVMKF